MNGERPGAVDWAADPEVETQLERLPKMPIAELRSRYRELFRTEPPKAFGPDLLRRSIAHRIQERAYGGLSREHQRLPLNAGLVLPFQRPRDRRSTLPVPPSLPQLGLLRCREPNP